MNQHLDADVIVVGAGPAGSAAAAQLASAGWDVLMVDRADYPRDKTCGDAVAPRAIKMLHALGAHNAVAAQSHKVTAAELVSPSGRHLRLTFDQHLDGWPHYVLTIPRLSLDNILRQHAVSKGARFLAQVKVTGPLADGTRGVAAVHAGQPASLRARAVVLAVGANMALLKAFGFLDRPPGVIPAARGYWQDVQGGEDSIWFYFDRRIRHGYAWLFPVGNRRANVGLGFLSPQRAAEFHSSASTLGRFIAEYRPIGERLQSARPAGPVKGYPIRTDFPPPRIARDGVALVGEACGLVNPVTGEGIDLALESGVIAAAEIDRALRADGSAALEHYEQAIRAHFGQLFHELRWLRDIVMRPTPLDILIGKGRTHPDLVTTIAYICLGLEMPRRMLGWKVWRDLLF